MIEHFKVITITHHVIDVAEIEDYIIRHEEEGDLVKKLQLIKDELEIDEMSYLSTCNRVSYMIYTHKEVDLDFINRFFDLVNPSLHLEDSSKLSNLVSVYEGLEAIQNVFEVACSVDSLVVGEREIFRQFREAINFARQNELASDNFRLIEKAAVETAKKVYSNTRIGEKPLSIAALAMDSLLQYQPSKDSKVIFVGAGETNSLMAKFFLKHEFTNFTVFNRSNHRGETLANAIGAQNLPLAALGTSGLDFDIMVVCTASTNPIITAEIYEKLIGEDHGKKIIIDLSVPANVSKAVVEQFPAEYIEIESLKSLAEKNLAFRRQEIGLAKAVISQQVNAFKALYQQRKLARALADLPTEIKSLKERVKSEVFKDRIEMLDEPAKMLISDILDYFEKKSISIPMKTAKKAFDLD